MVTDQPPVEITYDDALALERAGDQRGVYWARALRPAARPPVVIVTEVPGNPGPPVTEMIGSVLTRTGRRRIPSWGTSIWVVSVAPSLTAADVVETFTVVAPGHAGERLAGRRLTGAALGRLVGGPVPDLPVPWEMDRRVRLAGGRVNTAVPLDLAVVSTRRLPEPAGSNRCPFRPPAPGGRASRRPACPYYGLDWSTVAAASVQIVERLGGQPAPDRLAAEIASAPVGGWPERWALESLFLDPIAVWKDEYINGHCRGCPLRRGDAAAVVAAVG